MNVGGDTSYIYKILFMVTLLAIGPKDDSSFIVDVAQDRISGQCVAGLRAAELSYKNLRRQSIQYELVQSTAP